MKSSPASFWAKHWYIPLSSIRSFLMSNDPSSCTLKCPPGDIFKGSEFLNQVRLGGWMPAASQGKLIGDPYSPKVSDRRLEEKVGFSEKENPQKISRTVKTEAWNQYCVHSEKKKLIEVNSRGKKLNKPRKKYHFTQDDNFGRRCDSWMPSSSQSHLTSISSSVSKIHRQQRQGFVPGIIKLVGNSSVFNQDVVLQPQCFQFVKRPVNVKDVKLGTNSG